MTKPIPAPLRLLLILLTGLACLAVFFRVQLMNGFTLLLGDRHDGVIELAILEHWYNVLSGTEAWNRTAYFWPVPGTLGYNDGYLGFGLVYAVFRALGVDPFLAGELVNATLRGIGFLGAYVAMRRIMALEFGWALLGAAVFTLGNNLYIRGSHAQLFSVGLVPWLAVLAHATLSALWHGERGALLRNGAGFCLLFALALMTGFYMAWYFAFLSMALLIAWVVVAGRARRALLLLALKRHWKDVLGLGVFAALVCLPFALVYAPKAAETGMHGYAMVGQYTLSPLDVIHVGERNLVWGWLVQGLNAVFRPGFPAWSEQMTGMPPLLVALFLLALWRGPAADRLAVLRALGIATLVTWLLTLQLFGVSPWRLVWQVVPGARAARVVARYQLFLLLPVTGFAVAWLALQGPRLGRLLAAALCALLLVEQLNGYAPVFLDRTQELARLRAVPAPPAECRAFFVTAARQESRFGEAVDDPYNHNTEAMLLAEVLRLPTINGISTFNPPGWPDHWPGHPDYLPAVRAYAERYGVQGLCGLDLQRFTWDTAPFRD